MNNHQDRKRYAVEPVEALLGRGDIEGPRPPKRPASLTLGAVFVFFRAFAGLLWIGALWLFWSEIRREVNIEGTDEALVLWLIVGLSLFGVLVLTVLGVAVLRGSNLARVLVMCGLTFSITMTAIGYFLSGEQITIQTTLLTVALDILVLLALSSREARNWVRPR